MKRVLVLCVAACGASAPRAQPTSAPIEPAPVEPARVPSSQIVDTSIADDGEEPAHYIVAGVLDKDDREPVRGAAARGFFTSRTVSHFTVRITCH